MLEVSGGPPTVLEIERAAWWYSVIRALVSVGCPEQLRDGPLAVAELAQRCDAHAPTLRRLLRAVAQTGLVRSLPADRYELTSAGRELATGRTSLALKYNADPEIWGAFGELTETVRTGVAPFVLRNGNVYDYLADKPALSALFDEFMEAGSEPIAASLAALLAEDGEFPGAGTVVDVGGGKGTFTAAILRADPSARGVILDLARTASVAEHYLAGSGVADRCEFVAGDFFAQVPAGADTYLLSHVLHNWNDEWATGILRSIRAAIPAHGRLLIVEQLLPDDDRPHYGKDIDIRMLTFSSGKERTDAEYFALLAEAGFNPGRVAELASGRSLITATPEADLSA